MTDKHDPMSVRVNIPKAGPSGHPDQSSGTENVSLAFILNKWGGLRLPSGDFPYDDISALCKALAAKSFLNRYEIIGQLLANGFDHVLNHINAGCIKREELAAAIYLIDNKSIGDSSDRVMAHFLSQHLSKCVE